MGKGRTGTILTAVYMQAFNVKDAEEAINYIRENYLSGAVETIEQIESLKVFGSYLE